MMNEDYYIITHMDNHWVIAWRLLRSVRKGSVSVLSGQIRAHWASARYVGAQVHGRHEVGSGSTSVGAVSLFSPWTHPCESWNDDVQLLRLLLAFHDRVNRSLAGSDPWGNLAPLLLILLLDVLLPLRNGGFFLRFLVSRGVRRWIFVGSWLSGSKLGACAGSIALLTNDHSLILPDLLAVVELLVVELLSMWAHLCGSPGAYLLGNEFPIVSILLDRWIGRILTCQKDFVFLCRPLAIVDGDLVLRDVGIILWRVGVHLEEIINLN